MICCLVVTAMMTLSLGSSCLMMYWCFVCAVIYKLYCSQIQLKKIQILNETKYHSITSWHSPLYFFYYFISKVKRWHLWFQHAQASIEEVRSLKSKLHLSEQAQTKAQQTERDYEEVVAMLENEVSQLRLQLSKSVGDHIILNVCCIVLNIHFSIFLGYIAN